MARWWLRPVHGAIRLAKYALRGRPLGRPSWQSIVEGQTYSLAGTLGGRPFFVDGRGTAAKDVAFTYERRSFLHRFYEGERFIVNWEGRELLNMSWRAGHAIDELVACASGAGDLFAR